MTEQTFTIRNLVDEFDVTARAVRFYEQKGLLSPDRVAGQRVYSSRDRVRLSLIVRGKRFGFSLAEIRELLDLYDPQGNHRGQIVSTLDAAEARIASLESQRAEIDQTVHELRSVVATLKRTLDKLEGVSDADDLPDDLRQDIKTEMMGHGAISKSGEQLA
ncbi:MAG: MerR family DNA-binding transcriptional regulator [Alphaproteobacteria bacterium]